MKITFVAAPALTFSTEEDVRNYFDVVVGARERAIAQHAQSTAAVVSTLVATLMVDADNLSPASKDALADAARVLRGIEAHLSALVRRHGQRPTRALS